MEKSNINSARNFSAPIIQLIFYRICYFNFHGIIRECLNMIPFEIDDAGACVALLKDAAYLNVLRRFARGYRTNFCKFITRRHCAGAFNRKFVINSQSDESIDARAHRHLFVELSFLLIRCITKYRV